MLDALEAAGALIHRRGEDERRVDEHLADHRDGSQLAIVLVGVRNVLGEGNGGDLRTGTHLAINARVVAGDGFLEIAVGAADKVGKSLDRAVKGAVRATVELL